MTKGAFSKKCSKVGLIHWVLDGDGLAGIYITTDAAELAKFEKKEKKKVGETWRKKDYVNRDEDVRWVEDKIKELLSKAVVVVGRIEEKDMKEYTSRVDKSAAN
jgi:hypothetical protein